MRIACLAFTPLAEDARVQRTASALSEAGHDVLVLARPPFPENGAYRVQPLPPLASPAMQRLSLVATQGPATVLPQLASSLYWLSGAARLALKTAISFGPDVVYCNDWLTLPVGAAVRRIRGAKLVYDTHELATREHIQNWKWRLVSHRAVAVLEKRNIHAADLVLTVSEGIAKALQNLYKLARKPTVIRNLPAYRAISFREIRAPASILFHGLIRPERGLEELIDSMPDWRLCDRLVIRGYGQQYYIDSLRDRAVAKGLGHRVAFQPRVSPDRLITEAASADIGYLALPGTTEHYEYALPNKLFEYLMAGLPVMATRRAEMAAILASTGAGFLTDLAPQSLAATLNGLSVDKLNEMRRAALAAAKTLNWEHEKARLTEAVGSLASIMSGRGR
jgi:glycogen synthase